MKKNIKKIISGILVLCALFSAFGTACLAVSVDNVKSSLGATNTSENANLESNISSLSATASLTSKDDIYLGSMFMKLGVEYMLVGGVRTPILQNKNEQNQPVGEAYGAPRKHTDEAYKGKIMIPLLPILDYMGATYSEQSEDRSLDIMLGEVVINISLASAFAIVSGIQVELTVPLQQAVDVNNNKYYVIALDDIELLFPGFHVSYDEMGLIGISRTADIFDRANDLNWMLKIMKAFVFDYVTPSQIYEDVKENTNNFQHPYLYTNQERFDELREIYYADEGSEKYNGALKAYMQSFVSQADNYLNASYVDKDADGNFVGFNEHPFESVFANYTDDGYNPDNGGRWSAQDYICLPLVTIAFAYQVTADENYALFIYDWIILLGELKHWGPAHFLNTAMASTSVATAIDWIYNEFKNDADRPIENLIKVLYTQGVYQGYRSSYGLSCLFPGYLMGTAGYKYQTRRNNWNAVCSSGMIIASLITMEVEKFDDKMPSTYTNWNNCRDTSTKLISNNFKNFATYGLDPYAPDGSYVESASYWSYGTNYMFEMIICLDSAAGTDYGLMDSWGLDRTCYFAVQIEDSNGFMWGYHDGGSGAEYKNGLRSYGGGLGTQFFSWVGNYIKDYDLCRLRKSQIQTHKKVTLFDCIYYEYMIDGEVKLDLQYKMEGIDGYVVRSSWNKDSLYAGIMGGKNNVSHGQLDIGNFIYHNGGIMWITDLGSDNYNVYKYFGNFHYYKLSAEGNNVLLIDERDALKYGQAPSGDGKITETFDNEHGAYVILDTSSAYPNLVTEAKRGMFVTNDRKTVVIQDELSSKDFEIMYWIAHYDMREVDGAPEISKDGKRAYLYATNKETAVSYTLRMTLISNDPNAKFVNLSTVEDYYGNEGGILSATYKMDSHLQNGGQAQYSRNDYGRLVVRMYGNNVQMAVVMELVDRKSEVPVGYTYKSMSEWSKYLNLPSRDFRYDDDSLLNEYRGAASVASFRNCIIMAKRYYTETNKNYGKQFTADLVSYYRIITDIRYNYDECNEQLTEEQLSQHEFYTGKYEEFVTLFNTRAEKITNTVNGLFGRNSA